MLLVAAVVLLLGMSAPASAFTTQEKAEVLRTKHKAALDRLLYLRSPVTPPAGTGSAVQVASDWYMAEHRPMPGQPSSADIHSQLNRATRKARLLPSASSLLSRFSVLGSAAYVGWQIGSGINARYIEGRTPTNPNASGRWSEPKLDGPYEKGAVITWTHTKTGNPADSPRAPAEGWQLYNDGPSYNDLEWETYEGRCTAATWAAPGGMKLLGPAGSACSSGVSPCCIPAKHEVAYYVPMFGPAGQGVLQGPTHSTPPAGFVPTHTAAAPSDPGATTVAAATDDFLNDPATNADAIDWLYNEAEAVTIPKPELGETHPQYVERLQDLGLVGRVTIRSDTTSDPDFGPDVVIAVSPAGGTRVAPGTIVRVQANPGTAGEPANHGDPETGSSSPVANPNAAPGADGGSGGCGLPAIRSVNLDPLKVGLGNVFPFGIFVWLWSIISEWTAAGVAPVIQFEVPLPSDTDSGVVSVDLAFADPVLSIIHPVLILAAILVMGITFARWAMGGGGSTGS